MPLNNTDVDLFKKQVGDIFSRENFKKIMNFLRDCQILKAKFEFREISIPTAVTNHKVKHNFTFTPRDAFIVFKSDPSVTVTLNQNLWNADTIDITTTGKVDIKLFIGRYAEDGT